MTRLTPKRNAGWDVSIFDFQHPTDEGRPAILDSGGIFDSGKYRDVIETGYLTRGSYFPFMVERCQTMYLHIEAAWGLALHGKRFALGLSGECFEKEKKRWVRLACVTELALIDTKGTGKFDVLEVGKALPDSIPDWVNAGRKP